MQSHFKILQTFLSFISYWTLALPIACSVPSTIREPQRSATAPGLTWRLSGPRRCSRPAPRPSLETSCSLWKTACRKPPSSPRSMTNTCLSNKVRYSCLVIYISIHIFTPIAFVRGRQRATLDTIDTAFHVFFLSGNLVLYCIILFEYLCRFYLF